MSDFQALHLLLTAGELFAISALILAAAWLYARGKAAGQRHLIWASAFGALLAVPVLEALLPGSIIWRLPAPEAVPAMILPQDFGGPAVAPAVPSFQFDTPALAPALLVLWLAGFGAIVLRSLFAALVLNRLRGDSIENPFEASELPPFARQSRAELRVSNGEHGPITWGIFKPVILLPQRALYWSGERLEAVLLHELAHVRRNDSFAQLLSLLACALYWPNPLVWMAAARMRRDAEMATDDAVLSLGVRASDYAGELLQIAAELRARPLSAFAPMHMASPSALEARVKSVLAPATKRSGVTTMDVLKTMAAALLATSALVIARPSLAQDSQAVQSEPLAPPVPAAQPTPGVAPAPAAPGTPATPATAPVTDSEPAAAPAEDAGAFAWSSEVRPTNVQIRTETRRVNGHNVSHMWVTVNGVTHEVNLDDAAARAQPEIRRALAQVRANEARLRAQMAAQERARAAMEETMRRVGPEVQAALARAQADLAKADIDLRIQQRLDMANKRLEIRIETRPHQMVPPQPDTDGEAGQDRQ